MFVLKFSGGLKSLGVEEFVVFSVSCESGLESRKLRGVLFRSEEAFGAASIFEVSLSCNSLNSEAGGLSSANPLSFNVSCVFSV